MGADPFRRLRRILERTVDMDESSPTPGAFLAAYTLVYELVFDTYGLQVADTDIEGIYEVSYRMEQITVRSRRARTVFDFVQKFASNFNTLVTHKVFSFRPVQKRFLWGVLLPATRALGPGGRREFDSIVNLFEARFQNLERLKLVKIKRDRAARLIQRSYKEHLDCRIQAAITIQRRYLEYHLRPGGPLAHRTLECLRQKAADEDVSMLKQTSV